MSNTVCKLRRAGYKVKVSHLRVHIKDKAKKNIRKIKEFFHKSEFEDIKLLWPRGGKTVVEITTPDGKQFKEEVPCSPHDGYNKSIGLSIALGHVLKNNNIEV
jgi:hypothetical protein